MSRLGAAVNILTTQGIAGRHGMTASAVCSVSDTPASLLVCLNRNSRMRGVVEANGGLCVNVLAAEQAPLSRVFATQDMSSADRFAHGTWRAIAGGAALDSALASLGCRLSQASEIGSHTVFVCEVVELVLGPAADGLVYFDRAYHPVPCI